MKKSIVYSSICSLLLITSANSMSLRDSVEKTIISNPDIQAERKNQDAFRMYVDEREGRYLPTLDIEAYLESSKEERQPDDATNTDGRQDGYNAAIILRQYVYDGGLTPSQVAETVHQDRANKNRSLYAIENTVLETVKAYNGLVQSNEILVLTEDMIKIHEENLITAKEKEEISGEVLETYQVTSKLYFMTDRFIEEKENKDTGVALFKKLSGVDLTGQVCRPVIDESYLPSNLDETIKKAVVNNYRIKEQIERIKLQREKIAQYDATFLPSLNIELKASYDDDLELSENGVVRDQYARLNLNWNLFNGNRDNIRSQQEMIFLQEQKKTLDEITNDVVREMKSLYSKFTKNKERVEALKKYVEANVNIVEVYKSEFEAGTRTFVDILDAESELYNSSRTLINVEQASINNYYDILFNLSILSDTVLRQKNQDCSTVEPRKIYIKPTRTNNSLNEDLEGLISDTDSNLIKKELGLEDEVKSDKKTNSTSFLQKDYLEDFLKAPSNYFTINIATLNLETDSKEFFTSKLKEEKTFFFPFGKKLENAKLLYGLYSSVDEANLALENLNKKILMNEPYIDNVSKHQNLYAKYN